MFASYGFPALIIKAIGRPLTCAEIFRKEDVGQASREDEGTTDLSARVERLTEKKGGKARGRGGGGRISFD